MEKERRLSEGNGEANERASERERTDGGESRTRCGEWKRERKYRERGKERVRERERERATAIEIERHVHVA